MSDGFSEATLTIRVRRRTAPPSRAILIGVTGIDGCGKGFLAGKVVSELQSQGLGAVEIHADQWLNLPHKRFNPANPAKHFYENAIRFDEMFDQLVLPLKEKRRHRLSAEVVEETASTYSRQIYEFEEVDVIVLEGIYLLKHEHRRHFDLALWIDCSFQTALERALQRRQEGLSEADTIRAYEAIYFPAQRIHFTRDNPRAAADRLIRSDPRLDDLEWISSGRNPVEPPCQQNFCPEDNVL